MLRIWQAILGGCTPADEGQLQQDALPRKGRYLKDKAALDSTSSGKKAPILFGRSPASERNREHAHGLVLEDIET